jgi:hypothetical protein
VFPQLPGPAEVAVDVAVALAWSHATILPRDPPRGTISAVAPAQPILERGDAIPQLLQHLIVRPQPLLDNAPELLEAVGGLIDLVSRLNTRDYVFGTPLKRGR